MGMGIWLIAGLLLGADPQPDGPVAIEVRDFKIPVILPEGSRADIREVILFESADKGGQ